jgi:hypothetical protein
LQDVDPHDVVRLPDLEALLSGLDGQHLEDAAGWKDRVDEPLRLREFDIDCLEISLPCHATS